MPRPVLLLFFLVAGCGGEVRQVESGDAATSSGGQAGAPSGGGTGLSGGNVALPSCKLGFKTEEQPSLSCDFVVDGRCYASKVDACACACPPNRPNTRCTSGFPVPNGHVVVTCF